MEIRLNCFNSVELNGFFKLKNIKLEIISYNLNNNILSGNVKTTGEYFKINDEKSKGFEDIVPFEIVFKDTNIKIDSLYIENELFTFKETVGIKMQYEIVVHYSLLFKNEITDEEKVIEVPVEIEEEYAVINEDISKYDVSLEDKKCDFMENVSDKENEITEYYDKKLYEAFNDRLINNVNLNNTKDKVSFFNQKSTFKTITVYYLNKENEIELIAKEKRIAINKLYNNNDDFSKTHRLIVNE